MVGFLARPFVRGVLAGVLVAVVLGAAAFGLLRPGAEPSKVDVGPGRSAPASTVSPVVSGRPEAETAPTGSSVGVPAGAPAGSPATTGSAPAVLGATVLDCPPATIQVATSSQLQAALDSAAPGASIHVADGTYAGAFVVTRSGSEAAPIFLCGSRSAVLLGAGPKDGYVLHLRSVAYWRVVGLSIQNGQKGVVADATTFSVLQGLAVSDIGDEGIHLRSHSSWNVVLGTTVRRTGLRREKFGEGIYVGSATSNWATYSGGGPDRSDHNLIEGNHISETQSESIDIKEGTTGGRVVGNTMDGAGMTGADSLIDVKGNDWSIEGNIGRNAPKEGFQTHRILEGWGARNVFSANSIGVDGKGDHIWVHDPDITDNHIACDNRTDGDGPIRSNVPCSP